MVNLLKYKHKLCRKYNEDIWGFVVEKGKFDKLGEYLAGADKKSKRLAKTQAFKEILNDRKKVCLFYGGLKVNELMRFCNFVKYNGRGSFSDDVASLLERQLAVVVFRMNFVSSISQGKAYIKAGYFLVNKEIIYSTKFLVPVGSLIEVNPNFIGKLSNEVKARLSKNYLPLVYPKYLEVNYNIFSGVLLYEPKMEDIYYPFNLEENFFYIMYHSRI